METLKVNPFTIPEDEACMKACTLFINGGKHNFLFNPSFGTSILLDKENTNQILDKNPGDDLQFKLVQRGFMEVPGCNACISDEGIMPNFFIIDLTQACNFRCAYCFRHLNQNSTTVTDQNLVAIVNYIIEHCQKNNLTEVNVQPWGGEPLLAWKKIVHMHDMFLAAGLKPVFVIESNAGLITKEIAAEAYKRDIRIGVSIDGPPELHNSQRKLASGKPSFEKMYEGMQNLREAGFGQRHGVITVLTRNGYPHVEEMLEYFAVELGIDRLRLNVVKDSPMMKDKNLCLTGEEIADFNKRLVKKLIELNKRGYPITEINVVDKLNNLLTRKRVNICNSRGCMGGKKMIAFDQDGRIFPCDITDYKDEAVGSVFDGEDLVELLTRAHSQKSFFRPKEDPDCAGCTWAFFCKGGCTNAILYKKGEISGIDQQECITNKTLYPALIDMIMQEPGVLKTMTKNQIEIV
jgi:uncharacterized protein